GTICGVGGSQSRVGAPDGTSCDGLAPCKESCRTIRPCRSWLGHSEGLDQSSRIRAKGFEDAPTLFLCGRDHRTDGDEVIGAILRAEATGDLLLDLHHPPVLFGLIVSEGNVSIGKEAQHIFLAGAQAQQKIVTGAPSLTTAALALAWCGRADERGLGLMEGYPFLEDTLVTLLEECDQRRFLAHPPVPGGIDRMTGAAQQPLHLSGPVLPLAFPHGPPLPLIVSPSHGMPQ